jgi:hypothetical protein
MNLKEEAVRAGMRVKVRDHHRIEKRRGLVGKVVGTYGGEGYTAVEVQFPGGQRRLFWPSDLEIVSSTKPWWLSLLSRNRKNKLDEQRHRDSGPGSEEQEHLRCLSLVRAGRGQEERRSPSRRCRARPAP